MFKVILGGRITKDPEIKEVDNSKVCNFTVAAKNKKKELSYIRCSVWNKSAEAIEQYVEKGKQLFMTGDAVIKRFPGTDGIERDVLNVHIESIEFGSDPLKNAKEIEVVIEDGII